MYNTGQGVEIGFDSTNASCIDFHLYDSTNLDYDARIEYGSTSGTNAGGGDGINILEVNFHWNSNSIATQASVNSNFISTLGGTYTGPITCNGLTSNNGITSTSLTLLNTNIFLEAMELICVIIITIF